ncbi:GGDEF domain-containing protein [Hyphomicrobium sp.]|uniref:GGDEF domain-containing protein n=1 Tax=Hyphomicrobium sp. TaxID=82 RepID=UPI002E37FF82|nr:GGDEF domain-containing protein [Hyphomicrobium sp.]HEX2843145.1 GGDEF domain-containing protein [Hyphomicrobium sp.]
MLTAVAICGAVIALVISDADPASLLTLRTVSVSGGSAGDTRYNLPGIFAFGVLAASVCGGVALLGRLVLPLIHRDGQVSIDRVASTTEAFGRELANVLAIIRSDLANREAYRNSLANAQARLVRLTEAEQVRVIASLLVAENERMRLASVDDKGKIEACAREIESLQTRLRGAEEETLKDPLTGIGNRRLFDAAMKRAVDTGNADQTPLSLIMCDIDHFKRVNDVFGHHVGDEIIKALAGIIEANVRETDSVARYGGEEFAIILPGTKQHVAKEMAERIRRKFGAKQFAIRKTNQKIGQVTASFGVAEHRPGDDAQTFVQRADAKLYEAKARGRDRVADFG